MPIDFPKSPSTDDTYTYLTTTWKWNGSAWERSAATETGNTEGTTGGIAYYEGNSSTIKGALNAFYDETNERVGIGTSGPTELLDVRGGITASGGIFVTGGATFGSHVGITGGLTADTLKVESELILGGNIILPDEGHIGGGDGQDRIVFDINGNHIDVNTNIVRINSKLEHLGDDNTHLDFDTTDSIKLTAGGNEFLHGTATAVNIGGCTFEGSGGFTASTLQVSNDMVISGNIVVTEDAEVSIGGDTEKITFNGGSARIDISAGTVMVDQYIGHAGDPDTWQRFQTNQWSLNAGGTTVIDANASGITMDQAPLHFKTYTEIKNAISDQSSNFDVTVSAGSVQTVKCTSGTIEVGFTGWNPATNIAQTVTLIIEDGGNINTWDSAVKWPSNVAPSLTADGFDIITFMTPDAGTTVYGFVGGLDFS